MDNSKICVRAMADTELELWGGLRTELWPDCFEPENREEYAAFRAGTSSIQIVFLAFAGSRAIGFAEISERNVVSGCGNEPAAYLEGWYVQPAFQRSGIGSLMIEASVVWARSKGYQYLGSDVEPHNVISQNAHEKLGFTETGRSINYYMPL